MSSLIHHSPPSLHNTDNKRPKGILKTSTSYHRSPTLRATVTDPAPVSPVHAAATEDAPPPMERRLSEKDIVLHNTLQNAGRRRSSSGSGRPGSRRQSSNAGDSPTASPRLKWDEANLYLTEQQKSSTMKIDEPKTPYAKRYDPAEDEAEMHILDADDLIVDELDGPIKGSATSPAQRAKGKHHATREEDIPGLELGEPEELVPKQTSNHASPKQVIVLDDEEVTHDQDGEEIPEEEREKHKKFAELRKRHYEMKDVKELLGHPEETLEDEEDDDGDVELTDAPNGVPPVPSLANGEGSSS
ncbi:hypothetical protein DFH27DRAFT_482930 [Peziza echinospora]|nr:hypothetical protein DFH27DRAFT_482930 [Peziza echinospora]